jgi:hypothetical protein
MTVRGPNLLARHRRARGARCLALSLIGGSVGLAGCTTYRAYPGDRRPPQKVATLECDLEGVLVRRIDKHSLEGGWSEFEVLPGTHSVSAELFWMRLEKRVEGPEKSATFVAKPGRKYVCAFDVDEKKPDWALVIVEADKVPTTVRTFHGARTWITPAGECVRWDPKAKGCLGDPANAIDDEPGPEAGTDTAPPSENPRGADEP